MGSPTFPPELEVVVSATRLRLGGSAVSLLAAADRVTRWDLAVEIARWHRLDPFLLDACNTLGERVPRPVSQALEGAFRAAASQNLLLVGALTQVAGLLDEAGIPFVTLKGPPLAMAVHGDLVHRRSRDLDILVSPGDVDRTIAVLARAGYALERSYSPSEKAILLRTDKELKLFSGELLLELHWGFAHIDSLFPAVTAEEPTQTQVLGGREIPVLAEENRLAYLAFHAARHFWFRLFWLADFAFYLQRHPPADWDRLLARVRTLGQERTFCFSLVMAGRIFGYEPPPAVTRIWQASPALERYAAELVAIWSALPEPGQPYRITDPITRVYRWMLRMFPHERRRILMRTLFRPTIHDVLALPLPDRLYPIYYLIRPFRLAFRLLRGR